MKRKSIIMTAFVVLLSIFVPLLSGCQFFEDITQETELAVINASFSSENRVLSWVVDPYAVKYEVVVNQQVVKTYSNFGTPDVLQFDISSVFHAKEWMYRFYVRAYDQAGNNRKSQDFSYENKQEEQQFEITTISYDNPSIVPTGVEFKASTNLLSWQPVDNVSSYVVLIATSATDIEYVSCTERYLNVYPYTYDNEIFMFNVGVQVGQTLYLKESNQQYYNTERDSEALAEYKNKVYFFDGVYNDFFITNQDELNHFFYYTYIYKHKQNTFQCLSSFINTKDALVKKLEISKQNMYESYAYTIGISKIDIMQSIFTISFDFYGQEEPFQSAGIQPVAYYNQEFEPYYELFKGEKGVDYFPTDHRPVSYTVTTSDQLYHVIESGARPKFLDETSTAFKIYEEAKYRLNTIISKEMTDYEKALSIFDWLVISARYDQNVQGLIQADNKKGATTTSYKSFYLEGVFIDHVAVCDGYAKAYSLLCNMVGVDCVRIVGTAGSGTIRENHAWNKVKIGNMWYVVDVTWANKIVSIRMNHFEVGTHTYFMVSDYDVSGYDFKSGSHLASDFDTYKKLPATDDTLNYYNYMNYQLEDTTFSRYINEGRSSYCQAIVQNWQKYIIAHPNYSLEVFIDKNVYNAILVELSSYGLGYLEPITTVVEIGLSDGTYAQGHVVLIQKYK